MRLCRTLMAMAGCAVAAYGQPAFEVASIKLYDPASAARYAMRGGPGTADPTRFSCENCSLRSLIAAAYDIKEFQLTSASVPDRYDVEAKVPPDATKEQFRLMLQNLLAERFQLKLHHQPQEMTVYMLIVGKGGSKLTASESPASPPGSIATSIGTDGNYRMGATNTPMTKLVSMLSTLLAKPVRDATGLEGGYDFQLYWSGNAQTDNAGPRPAQDGSPMPGGPNTDFGPTLFTAIQQQLGLKLESKKDQVDVLVVDHAEKVPTVN